VLFNLIHGYLSALLKCIASRREKKREKKVINSYDEKENAKWNEHVNCEKYVITVMCIVITAVTLQRSLIYIEYMDVFFNINHR